jgi:putative phage-type endonuclease
MKIHQIDQRSDEWFEIRRGKMTASNAQAISANSKGLETYIIGLLAEKYSNNREHYTNGDMDRGVELEEAARMTYELEYEKVEEVGFIEMDEHCGCSPDGLVGEDGGVEIKCVNDVNFFKLMVDGEKAIESKYKWQVQMCMLVSGRKWWDLVVYNPNFEKNLIVVRMEKDLVMQEKLIIGIEKGKKLIKDLEMRYAEKL